MKKIQVKITAELEVPDDWEIVEYLQDEDNENDKVKVLDMGGEYCNFTLDFLTDKFVDEQQIWTSDEDFFNAMISVLETVDVDIIEL